MSSSISKISYRKRLNPKINNLKLAPLHTNFTTAYSRNKNTFMMDSHLENINVEKTLYSTRNMNSKRKNLDWIPKDIIEHKYKRNISLKYLLRNKFKKPKKYSSNNKAKIYNFKTNNNSDNNGNIKSNSNKNIKRNKNSIIVLNKISGENNKSLKTFRQPIKKLFEEKLNRKGIKEKYNNIKKNLSNNETKKYNKSGIKFINTLTNKSSNNLNKKGISRNSNEKLQMFSIKNINSKCTSNSMKTNKSKDHIKNNTILNYNTNKTNYTTKISCSNSLNNNKKNKTVYYKKKMKGSFKATDDDNQKQKQNNKNTKKYLSNHHYLVNIILENKKNETNKKYSLHPMTKESKKIYSFTKKYDSKLLKDNSENLNNIFSRDQMAKNVSKLDKIDKTNVTKIVINKKNNNKILRKIKSVEYIQLIDKIKNKKSKKKINSKNKKNKIKIINTNNVKSNNSIINLGKKDSFLDMIEIHSKFNKDKNEKEAIINNIKINEFHVKTKEENMKFTLLKNKYGEESKDEEINKSGIIIGTIEGYKDIIESDKLNNNFSPHDNSINVFESNTLDNNSFNKKINKKILLNFNDFDGLEIYSNNTNGFILNESEINSLLNYVDDENDIGDLSTTVLKINRRYKNSSLYPYHVNIINFVKKYDNETRRYFLNENMNVDSILLVDNNKLSTLKNQENNGKTNYNKKVKSAREYKRDYIIKYMSKLKLNSQNKNNNVVEKSCNLFIEGNNKKCIIF